MKLYTGNYENCKCKNVFSISGDRGKGANFEGPCLSALAPKRDWWQQWHDNIGKIPEDENIAFYVRKYYETVLTKEDSLQFINSIPYGSILLCYEDPKDFCHREILAAYIELYYAIDVREVKVLDSGVMVVQKRNKYYESIKSLLEELIKKDIEMYEFESIAAAHAYSIALTMEANPEDCIDLPITADDYKYIANVLEDEYKKKKKKIS